MKSLPSFAAGLCLALVPAMPFAQGSDQAACAAQATQQTGYNPAQPPPPPAAASPQVAGSGSRARGAAAGAVIGGASGGDAGAGAAAGAVAGGVAQRSRNRRGARAQNDAAAQQQQAYNKALSNCLASRGPPAQ